MATTTCLYNGLTGEKKKPGDAPLGLAYDEDGIPHPDWSVEIEEGAGLPDSKTGRRRGAKIVGAIDIKDLPAPTRFPPQWGKRFGVVGGVGAFGLEEAILCLTSENFGWALDDDDDQEDPPPPPYVRLCYGELRGTQESIRLFTGLSEIHLLKDLDLRSCHYALLKLGYVCDNDDVLDEDRFWGPGINNCPQVVSSGTPQGPVFYSWHYRRPPWLPGLVKEGEDADYHNGPFARLLKKRNEHHHMANQKRLEDQLEELKLNAKDQLEDFSATALVAPDYDQDKE